jgi:hypothetical protein
MGSPRLAFVFALVTLGALPLAASCGGKELGGSSGGSPEGGHDDAVSPGGPPDGSEFDSSCPDENANPSLDGAGPDGPEGDSETEGGVSCTETSASGSGGGGGCTTMVAEKCSNGFSYQVSCTCPKATCDCEATSGSTSMSESGVHYSGCSSSCGEDSLAFEACGYPLYAQ